MNSLINSDANVLVSLCIGKKSIQLFDEPPIFADEQRLTADEYDAGFLSVEVVICFFIGLYSCVYAYKCNCLAQL